MSKFCCTGTLCTRFDKVDSRLKNRLPIIKLLRVRRADISFIVNRAMLSCVACSLPFIPWFICYLFAFRETFSSSSYTRRVSSTETELRFIDILDEVSILHNCFLFHSNFVLIRFYYVYLCRI